MTFGGAAKKKLPRSGTRKPRLRKRGAHPEHRAESVSGRSQSEKTGSGQAVAEIVFGRRANMFMPTETPSVPHSTKTNWQYIAVPEIKNAS